MGLYDASNLLAVGSDHHVVETIGEQTAPVYVYDHRESADV
jgi:hypothetical protein